MAEKGTRNHTLDFAGYTITVAMLKATVDRDPKLTIVDRETGKPRASGGGPGTSQRLAAWEYRGLKLADDEFVEIPQAELDAIREDSAAAHKTMRVLETRDYREVPTERIKGSYWLQPRGGTARGLAMLATALRDTGRVAIVKWRSGREHLGVIRVRGRRGAWALLLSELAFANDFRDPDEDALAINYYIDKLDGKAVDAARKLVMALGRDDVDWLVLASDEAVDKRVALVERLAAEHASRALEASVAPAEDDVPEMSEAEVDAMFGPRDEAAFDGQDVRP